MVRITERSTWKQVMAWLFYYWIDCGLGNRGATKLAELLKENTTLETLDLECDYKNNEMIVKQWWIIIETTANKVRHKGAKELCKALRVNKTLKELLMRGMLNDVWTSFDNKTQPCVWWTGNSIGNKGARYFGFMLSANKRIMKLDLGKNGIKDKGKARIREEWGSRDQKSLLF